MSESTTAVSGLQLPHDDRDRPGPRHLRPHLQFPQDRDLRPCPVPEVDQPVMIGHLSQPFLVLLNPTGQFFELPVSD